MFSVIIVMRKIEKRSVLIFFGNDCDLLIVLVKYGCKVGMCIIFVSGLILFRYICYRCIIWVVFG